MSNFVLYGLLGAGLLVIAVLAGTAWYYLRKVKEVEQQQQEAIAYLEEKIEQQRERRIKSVRIIAQGMIDDQLTLTEGAIRLSSLLGSMEMAESYREDFKAFFLLADATAHIPVLEEWKALSTKKKLAFDREREGLEKDHREFVLDASKRLIDDARFAVESVAFYQAK